VTIHGRASTFPSPPHLLCCASPHHNQASKPPCSSCSINTTQSLQIQSQEAQSNIQW
jgi:hypothetical protein